MTQIQRKIKDLQARLREVQRRDREITTKCKSTPEGLRIWNLGYVQEIYSREYIEIGEDIIRLNSSIRELQKIQSSEI